MTDTPRTDRVARGRSEIASPTVVDVEFARNLERELAALRAAQGEPINYTGRHQASFDSFLSTAPKAEPVAWRKDLDPPRGNYTLQWLSENPWPGQNHVSPLYAAPPASAARIAELEAEVERLRGDFLIISESERRKKAERDLAITECEQLREALRGLEKALRSDSRDKAVGPEDVEYRLDGQAMYQAINAARRALAMNSRAEGEDR